MLFPQAFLGEVPVTPRFVFALFNINVDVKEKFGFERKGQKQVCSDNVLV